MRKFVALFIGGGLVTLLTLAVVSLSANPQGLQNKEKGLQHNPYVLEPSPDTIAFSDFSIGTHECSVPQTTKNTIKREFPNKEQLKLIGRLSEGIKKVALLKGGGKWWNCGETYPDEEVNNAAMKWAYRIVYLAWDYSDKVDADGIQINPWGIAGTAANESGFDVCALGPWPRKWAYKNKIIKQRRRCISHPYAEIKKTMLHPKGVQRWKISGIDAAPLHLLWLCNEKGMCQPKFNWDKLPAIPLKEVFSLGKGFEYNVRRMRMYARQYRTDAPWTYWPGHKATWYHRKVVKWAHKMGATTKDI
jgi:hypothetical protein